MRVFLLISPLGVAVLVCIGILLGCSTAPPAQQPQDRHRIERVGTVGHVIDGDTISLQDGGRVRLVGIDAPSVRSGGGLGREAKEFVENLCPSGADIGLDVDDLKPVDRYGRILAVVYVDINGEQVNLNAELLRRGYAHVLVLPPSEFNPHEWIKDSQDEGPHPNSPVR